MMVGVATILNANILIVDDQQSSISLLEQVLGNAGYSRVSSTMNSQEVCELHRANRYDLILLDLNLPKKSGREVLEEIKEDPILMSIPVVVLTTSTSEQDILRSYMLHANCFITKPVDLDGFLKVVRSIDNFWLSVVKLPHEVH